MATNRIDKVNSLLEHEISQIMLREVVFPAGTMVTLTHVDTTANLIEARVFVSAFPEDKIDQVVDILNKDVFEIQQEINKKVNMRPVPRIRFVKDMNEAKAGRVEEILAQLKKEEK